MFFTIFLKEFNFPIILSLCESQYTFIIEEGFSCRVKFDKCKVDKLSVLIDHSWHYLLCGDLLSE